MTDLSRLLPCASTVLSVVVSIGLVTACNTGGLFEYASGTKTPSPTSQVDAPTSTSPPTNPPISERPTDTPSPCLGSTWLRPKDGMVMVCVPDGTFQMGSTKAEIDAAFGLCEQELGSDKCKDVWFTDAGPQHSVTLDGFWIDRTEVTNAQYKKCVEAKECQAPTICDEGEPTYEDLSKADHPVVCVDWQGAQAYCNWADARLPTEAEWEYAARGPDGNSFPWGGTFDGARLNFCDANCFNYWRNEDYDDGYEKTAPVGSFESGASWCGTLDMAGNVWEWVADWYGDYQSMGHENPTGPEKGEDKVLRGGSWDRRSGSMCSAFR